MYVIALVHKHTHISHSSALSQPTHLSWNMEFHKLPSNPNPKPNTSSPFLLEDMEQNQFIHSKTSHFRVIPPRIQKLRNLKKQKTHFKSPSIPFYQSSKYQIPNINSPRPKKPYWPKVYSRRQFPNPNPQIIPRPLPPPKLINLAHTKKYKDMIKKCPTWNQYAV